MKNTLGLLILLLLVIFSGASSCQRSKEQRYELKGKVVAVEPEKHLVTISHEEVKGFMPGMTMPFTVPKDQDMQILAPDDMVTATLVVDGAHSWLEDLIVTRQSTNVPSAPGLVEAKTGDELPNYILTNQDGKETRVGNYRGKTLLLTFIYTRCPIPEYCNLMSTNFAKVDRQLQQDLELFKKTHLLSISIDPEYDTPPVLRSYGAAYTERYQDETFEHWEFATGSKDQIKGIAQFFGLRYFEDNDQIVHSLRTAIITPDGKVWKVYTDNEWKPEEVVKEIQSAAGKRPD
jgi:protein SCO1/2